MPKTVETQIVNRKVILWKIHFPFYATADDGSKIHKTPDLDEYLHFADELGQYRDLFFILCPHPSILYGKYSEHYKPQMELLLDKLRNYNNVFIDTDFDYRSSLLRADAIIIDRSAIMIEAGITSKPILYVSNPASPEKISPALLPLVESYYQGANANDMISFLEQFKKGSDPNRELRDEAFRYCIPYTDGKCGKRIADDIAYSIMSEQQPVPIKVAVFGTGLTFKYYSEYLHLFCRNDIRIVVLSDNNKELWGSSVNGVEIVKPDRLQDYEFEVIVIFSEQHYRDLFKQLVYELNVDMDKIVRLDRFLYQYSYQGGLRAHNPNSS